MTDNALRLRRRRTSRRALSLAFALTVLAPLALPRAARAQDGGHGDGPPSTEEVVEKVKEIEKLMRAAEESLANSTRARRAREDGETAAKQIEELIDEQAQAQTGKSAAELRKEAAAGSAEAQKQIDEMTRAATRKIEELMKQSAESAAEAAQGVRRLLEKTSQQGQAAKTGIEWILENAVSHGGGSGNGGKPDKPKQGDKDPQGEKPKDPKDGKDKESPKDDTGAQKPESDTQPPRDVNFEVWLATLPPEARKAYESQDWDAAPVQYRAMLRAWSKKLADEIEKGRR